MAAWHAVAPSMLRNLANTLPQRITEHLRGGGPRGGKTLHWTPPVPDSPEVMVACNYISCQSQPISVNWQPTSGSGGSTNVSLISTVRQGSGTQYSSTRDYGGTHSLGSTCVACHSSRFLTK